MKRILSLVCVLIFTLTLCSCGISQTEYDNVNNKLQAKINELNQLQEKYDELEENYEVSMEESDSYKSDMLKTWLMEMYPNVEGGMVSDSYFQGIVYTGSSNYDIEEMTQKFIDSKTVLQVILPSMKGSVKQISVKFVMENGETIIDLVLDVDGKYFNLKEMMVNCNYLDGIAQ